MATWEDKVDGLVQWLKTNREEILETEYNLAKFVPGFTLDIAKMESRDRNWYYRKLVKDKQTEAEAIEAAQNG